MSLPLFTDVIISPIIVILVIIWLICYHRRDKSKVSKTAIQFVKLMRFLRCKCSAKKHKTDDDSNDRNSIKYTSDSGEAISWTNVREGTDIFFGFYFQFP